MTTVQSKFQKKSPKGGISIYADFGPPRYGTFLQQLECGYEFPALIHVWIASAGVLEWFISTSGEDLDLSLHSLLE